MVRRSIGSASISITVGEAPRPVTSENDAGMRYPGSGTADSPTLNKVAGGHIIGQ